MKLRGVNCSPMQFKSIVNLESQVQDLDIIVRTGGVVSQYCRENGKGYGGISFWDTRKTAALWQTWKRQRNWSENWIDVLGRLARNKEMIFVVNLNISVDENLRMIKRFESYGCKIIAVELGNENYYKVARMSIGGYLRACKPFADALGGKYKLLYQLTSHYHVSKHKKWDDAVMEVGEYFAVHVYPHSKNAESPKKILDELEAIYGSKLWITEFNLQEPNKVSNEVQTKWLSEFMEECDKRGFVHILHHLMGGYGMGLYDNQLNPQKHLIELF